MIFLHVEIDIKGMADKLNMHIQLYLPIVKFMLTFIILHVSLSLVILMLVSRVPSLLCFHRMLC